LELQLSERMPAKLVPAPTPDFFFFVPFMLQCSRWQKGTAGSKASKLRGHDLVFSTTRDHFAHALLVKIEITIPQ